MVFDQQTIDQMQDLSSTAKRQAKEFKRKAEEAEETEQLWIHLAEFLNAPYSV